METTVEDTNMKEVASYKFQDLSPFYDDAWKTFDFSKVDFETSKIEGVLKKLFQQLSENEIDCVWHENSYERVIWTRSLKEGLVQVTSFSLKFKSPNSDDQVSSFDELLDCMSDHCVYSGTDIHAMVL